MFEKLKECLKKPTAEWIQEVADENTKLRAENARLRERDEIAIHFLDWIIQWEADKDAKGLPLYIIDNAKLTKKEMNDISTPSTQAENVSKNSGEIEG